jgi:uncharacterized protein (DUF2147 family)
MLNPLDNVTDSGFAIGSPGQEYVVYINSTADVTATITSTSGLTGSWFDPRSGQTFSVNGTFKTGKYTFTPPDEMKGGDAVLHLTA